MKRAFLLILLTLLTTFFVLRPVSIQAQTDEAFQQDETLEAVVTNIISQEEVTLPGNTYAQLVQELRLHVTKGSIAGQDITIEGNLFQTANNAAYKVGDRLMVSYGRDFEGNAFYSITDYVRRDALWILFTIFIFLTVMIAKWRGLSSLFGMLVSFGIIFQFILPKISAGENPILIAILGSLIIIPATFYLSHGFNRKTTVAVIGTLVSLVVTGFLAAFFISAAKLTGYTADEVNFLQAMSGGSLNVKGLMLAGIIIGTLGILDDITISQSSIIEELHATDKKLSLLKLYAKGMKVGKDHISSLVNTLILVYTGAALPLLLLFMDSSRSFNEVVNYEPVAEEILRTLVASIGLIIAVPITTGIAVLVAKKSDAQKKNVHP